MGLGGMKPLVQDTRTTLGDAFDGPVRALVENPYQNN